MQLQIYNTKRLIEFLANKTGKTTQNIIIFIGGIKVHAVITFECQCYFYPTQTLAVGSILFQFIQVLFFVINLPLLAWHVGISEV